MAQVTGQALREMCYWLEGGMGVGGRVQSSTALEQGPIRSEEAGLHPSCWARTSLPTPRYTALALE